MTTAPKFPKFAQFIGLAALSLLVIPYAAEARPFISSQSIRQQPQQVEAQRSFISRLQLQRQRSNTSDTTVQPLNNSGSFDYQAFAPSAPTSGPQGIWKHGSCNNTVRVLVSNIGDSIGPNGTVTLTVPEPIDDSDYFNAPTVDVTYNQSFDAIAAGSHTWIEFSNVDFPEVFSYDLNATVTPEGDENPSNNSRTVNVFVNHSCS